VTDRDSLHVHAARPGAVKDGLNASGWFVDEVVAAGLLSQGRPPTLRGMVTGAALIGRARRSRALPREFVLAVTADRVVALALSPREEAEQETATAIRIRRDARGSWPGGSVRLIDLPADGGRAAATLDLAGMEHLPVHWNGEPDTGELVELLAG
jgi:hypothetical protein